MNTIERCTRLTLSCLWISTAVLACGARSKDTPLTANGPTAPQVNGGQDVIDSESHFLALCVGECGDGLRCACGVCTQVCDETPDCSALGQSVTCVEPTPGNPGSCAGQVVHKVCDQRCETSDDCEAGAVCSAGACRHAAPAGENCAANQTPACDATQELQSKQDESGCLELSCVPKSVCRLPYWKSIAGDCEDLTKQIYWYNSEAGRCQVKYTGDGCEPTQNAFESDQACWDACGPTDYGGRCFDTWRADWDAEEFTPSALLPAEPISLTHEQADALVASEYKAQLTYPDRSQSELTLSFSNAMAYWVTRRDNPLRFETGLTRNAGEIECPNGIVVEADARLTTADGRLNETWPGVQVVLGQRSASLGLALWVPGTWQEAQNYDVRVHGTYLPAITSEQCVLGTSLSLSLVDGAMSGSISHMLIDLPCAQVMPTTGISNPTSDGAMLPGMPPPPSGPVWSSLVVDPTAQFCVLESSNTKGPDEVASSVGLGAISDDDPATQPVVFRDVLGDCTAQGLKHCTPEGLITLWAAECLARASSFEAGIEAWDTNLVVHDDYEDPVWIVHSVLQRDGASSSGEDLIIDAATGEILTTLGWQQEP